MDWAYLECDEFLKKKKKWPKKHARELGAMAKNLRTVYEALKFGATLDSIRGYGFVHTEPMGMLAVDQKGGGSGLSQTRLYVYPDMKSGILHIITLGNKNSQKSDIRFCEEYVEGLLKTQED